VTKSRAFAAKSGQNISSSVGVTKSRAFAAKCGQNISSSLGVTKSRAFAAKCGQNCANLLCRNNISRASPANKSPRNSKSLELHGCPGVRLEVCKVLQRSELWKVQEVHMSYFTNDNLEAKLLFQFFTDYILSFVPFLDHEFSLCALAFNTSIFFS
jgi:hypothetical protein